MIIIRVINTRQYQVLYVRHLDTSQGQVRPSKFYLKRKIKKRMMSKLKILAGNARKVSAVRFERINNDDVMMEAKEVTRLVPRIMKRRWSSDEESEGSDYDENSFQKQPEHSLSDSNVIAEHEDDNESPGRQ